ncbi:MAG: YopX family protein [Endomicrobium sp.]|jgi:uncharacterized phage protein (TIGR01671 family)|nr:YopX family protein [Endomicrobium sp.]
MSRQVKFRAWIKEQKEMLEVHWLNCILEKISSDDEHGVPHYYNFDEIELMQYIGLKDKNGKEIYEDDFVVYDGYLYKIIWLEDEACFKMEEVLKSHPENAEIFSIEEFGANSLIVDGNIYDNPELLKGK